MKNSILIVLFPFLCVLSVSSQQIILTLEEAQQIARKNSNDILIIKYDSIIFDYQYKEFKAYALPQIKLTSKPFISQDITSITLVDGSEQYVSRRLANYGLTLGLTQLVPFTGGDISVSSSFNGVDNYAPNKYRSLYVNWINLSYNQNFGNYNEYKWKKRILNSQKKNKQIKYFQAIEELNLKVVDAYLEYYAYQKSKQLHEILLDIAQLHYVNSQNLYDAQRITREDLINAEIEYHQELVNYNSIISNKTAEEKIRKLLKIPDSTNIQPSFHDSLYLNIPMHFTKVNVVERTLYYNFKTNNEHQNLEHQKNIAENNFNSGIIWGISFNGGINKAGKQFPLLFDNPDNQYKISFSVSIPLTNWGATNYRKGILEAERILTNVKNLREEEEYKILVTKELDDILHLHESLKSSKRLLDLQFERMDILKEKLNARRIHVIDFARAKSELTNTHINHNLNLKKFVYLICKYRYLALWDIWDNKSLFDI